MSSRLRFAAPRVLLAALCLGALLHPACKSRQENPPAPALAPLPPALQALAAKLPNGSKRFPSHVARSRQHGQDFLELARQLQRPPLAAAAFHALALSVQQAPMRRVLNPELEPSEYGDKRAVLDILAAFEDGSRVDIEMQARPHEAIEERLVFYWAKTYASQLSSGDPHTHLKPVIGIYFLAFIRFPTSRAHSSFHINEDHEGFPLTDALELHFLDLPKYAAREERDRLPAGADGDQADELVYWCKFLAAETEAEQESLAMANSDILEAKTRLDELSADPKARKLAEDRALWEWAYDQDIEGAERRGRKEGRDEGLRDGRREGLLEAIATCTRCSTSSSPRSTPLRFALPRSPNSGRFSLRSGVTAFGLDRNTAEDRT